MSWRRIIQEMKESGTRVLEFDEYYTVTVQGDTIEIVKDDPYCYATYKTTILGAERLKDNKIVELAKDYVDNNEPDSIQHWSLD